jgi:hypothetical protein
VLESTNLMQQHDSNALIHEEKQRFNKLKRGEVMPRYRFASPPYYQEKHEDQELEEKLKILNLIFIMWLSNKP